MSILSEKEVSEKEVSGKEVPEERTLQDALAGMVRFDAEQFRAPPEEPETVETTTVPETEEILVTAEPGGATATTDASGHYSIEAMYAGSYTVTAAMEDWSTGVESPVTVVQGEMTYGVNFTLFPQTSSETCESPALAIPDNSPAGVYDTMVFTEDLPMNEVEVESVPVVEPPGGANGTPIPPITR